jgi:uncharacterized protein
VRNLAYLLLLSAGAYLVVCVLLFANQRAHIYYPVPESSSTIARSMRLQNGGADLKIWVIPRPGPRAILYFGGNAEDVAYSLESFAKAFPAHSLYLVNYRGYGGSSGEPTETGLQADALAVFDQAYLLHPRIAVIGRSLGSAVATHVANERMVDRLVLVTPFDSLVKVAGEHFRWLPVGLLIRDRYDSVSRAASIRAPVLMVVAGDDEIVSRARSNALAAAFAPGRARMTVLDGVGHNGIDARTQYLESIAEFLRDGAGV